MLCDAELVIARFAQKVQGPGSVRLLLAFALFVMGIAVGALATRATPEPPTFATPALDEFFPVTSISVDAEDGGMIVQ